MKSKEKQLFDAKAFLTKVGKGRTHADLQKGEEVYSQGEPADSVFFVQKGRVKITVVSEEGKEAVIAILGPGDFFGEGCLAGQPKRITTATGMAEKRYRLTV